jgi:glycosyltransferase involved in cell wall biosynthesis
VRVLVQAPRRRAGGPLGRGALATGALRSMLGVRTRVLVQRSAGPTTAIAAIAARVRGAGFAYSSANDVDFEFERVEPRRVNLRLFEWGVRRATRVLVQNDHQAQLCRQRFAIDPIVVNSIAARAEPRSADPEAFLWVGRLQNWKRPLAYLELARAVPEASFWMIEVPQPNEPPELRAAVSAAVRELPNLELLEPRPREALGELLDRTVAVVNTSSYEGVPNVFLEGWARGVPALALSFDPGGLVAGRGLGSFVEGDSERFADEAQRIWRERGDQRAVAERCIAYVRAEHDRDAVIDRWIGALGLSSPR